MLDATSAPVLSPTAARCAFCGHVNPPGAKYCNECAADLALTLCERCSAVNRAGMATCHKCGAPLPSSQALATVPEPAAPASTRAARSRGPIVALLTMLAAIVAAGWYFVHPAPASVAVDAQPTAAPSPPADAPAEEAPAAKAAPAPETAPKCPDAVAALSLCERSAPDEPK